MNDSHWDVNGDEGFDDPMIEDTGYADQDEGWSRRGSRIILGDDHEDEERLSIQAEKIVHKGFFNSTLLSRDAPTHFTDDFDDKDVA
ncbi:hypothetical protein INT43_006365 [Umbelopsis isabellina]|uniref:Uncharacterized protein n=1 Tax=Mortierella isabellina TaxID=91625 RepID=A0A8H7Q121_MORIS|nr:hypothetical protein INT43_006365 [Umbelopsis isabellina]